MFHVPPGGLYDLTYAPSGGAGLLFRPECDDSCVLNGVLYVPCGLHNVL